MGSESVLFVYRLPDFKKVTLLQTNFEALLNLQIMRIKLRLNVVIYRTSIFTNLLIYAGVRM